MYTFESMISQLLWHDTQATEAYFSCCYKPVSKSIKIFSSKIAVQDFCTLATKQWRQLKNDEFLPNRDVFYITRDDDSSWLWKHWLHNTGFFYMQEMAASLPAMFLDIKPGDIVLDMCAAPGWKSVQIADKWWYVVSNEVSPSRIIALQANLNRMGIINSTVTSIQWWQWGNMVPYFFDHVLVDAPCSGEWTGFKSDAGTKWRREDTIHKIARTQKEILISAIKTCKVWWTIVYSTCTINPWENECIIHDILQHFTGNVVLEDVDIHHKSSGVTHREWREILSEENAKKVARFWPHIQNTWGFFIAKLRKIAHHGDSVEHPYKAVKKISNLDISPSLQKMIAEDLLENYGIVIDPSEHFFISSQKQVYLTTPLYNTLHNVIFTEKSWVPIYKWDNNKKLIPLHGLWNCLWHRATKNTVSLPIELLQQYSDGHDIPSPVEYTPSTSHNYIILQREKYGFSVGKMLSDGYIKNKCNK